MCVPCCALPGKGRVGVLVVYGVGVRSPFLHLDNAGCGSTFARCENVVFDLSLRSSFTIFV